MKAFLKTLIGGALGLGALYVVGKVCFEAGKDVAEVERQLKAQESVDAPKDTAEPVSADNEQNSVAEAQEKAENTQEEPKHAWIGKAVSKVRNLKAFLRIKKAFEKSDRGPGVLGTLLKNPEGARIEAFVRNGGVQINVRPRAA